MTSSPADGARGMLPVSYPRRVMSTAIFFFFLLYLRSLLFFSAPSSAWSRF